MTNARLRDDQWEKMYAFLQQHPRAYAGQEAACRQFVKAVLWILGSGAQWRLLPENQGNWNTVYKRFALWCAHGLWADTHHHFANDPDMENILLDSTIVRAHPCAAGASKKTVGKKTKHSDAAGAGSARRSIVSSTKSSITGVFSHDLKKLDQRLLGFLSFVGALIWLR